MAGLARPPQLQVEGSQGRSSAMKDKDGGKKFKKTGKKGKNLQKMKKDELGWLAKNTRFAPESIAAWHKVG